MTQGNMGAWKKAVGDAIAPGDIVCDIETDKATMEFEAQEEGFLAKILMEEGTREAAVGVPIAVLVDAAADVLKFSSFTAADIGPTEGAAKRPDSQAAAGEPSSPPPQQGTGEEERVEEKAVTGDASQSQKRDGQRIAASPLAKKSAAALSIPLASVSGSGPGGRIIDRDVRAAAQAAASLPASATPFTDVPLSAMRKVIAQRLTASTQTIPHFYVTAEVQMDRIIALRAAFNKGAASGAADEGRPRLSLNDFIIKAAALALQDVPQVNSAWGGDFIRQYASSDVCVAVATPAGLYTPIVGEAHLIGLGAISAKVRDLAARARQSKLRPEEYQGGTFTISNLGMYGVAHFTAIINPPQACILAVGGTVEKLYPQAGETLVGNFMNVTLSCDHRVVDGAVGAQWLQAFKNYLQDPITMIL